MPSYAIIGASRGLGYAWLQELRKDPTTTEILGTARNPQPVIDQLAKDGIDNIHVLSADLTSHASLTAAAKQAESLMPNGIDYLIVNGALIVTDTLLLAPTDVRGNEDKFNEDFDSFMRTNTLGPLHAINAFLPLVGKAKTKKVIVISSGAGSVDHYNPGGPALGIKQQIGYSTSKAAVNMIVAKFAAEFKGTDYTFLSLCPGVVDTQIKDDTPPDGGIMKMFMEIMNHFSTFARPGFSGPIPPADSIKLVRSVIDSKTPAESGAYLSNHGDRNFV